METLELFTIQHAGDFSVMLFKETEGDRFLPMTTRNAQAASVEGAQIVTHQRGNVAKIHDLLRDIITALDGSVVQVRLSSVDAHGDYRASLELANGTGTIWVECRPSDAVAVARRFGDDIPIVADEAVLEHGAVAFSRQEPELSQELKQWALDGEARHAHPD